MRPHVQAAACRLVLGDQPVHVPGDDPRGDERDVRVGEVAREGEQHFGIGLHVVVDERYELRGHAPEAGVAGGGRSAVRIPPHRLRPLHAHRLRRCIVNHDHPQRCERVDERVHPVRCAPVTRVHRHDHCHLCGVDRWPRHRVDGTGGDEPGEQGGVPHRFPAGHGIENSGALRGDAEERAGGAGHESEPVPGAPPVPVAPDLTHPPATPCRANRSGATATRPTCGTPPRRAQNPPTWGHQGPPWGSRPPRRPHGDHP